MIGAGLAIQKGTYGRRATMSELRRNWIATIVYSLVAAIHLPQRWIQVMGVVLLGMEAVLAGFFNPIQAVVTGLIAASMMPVQWTYSWAFKPLHYAEPSTDVKPLSDGT
ncbi:hypothetical protein PSACC_00630 [Paramicrosporidium saccamoebae]|uniref:Uncharacterized protein n=1 Tax=Paramicrosporidium saccamoebae TaxID=1246581 RepID=A0A2H9TP78_9FUNG|nr:hypothetical protein PSACC_00630 [Paramicrosporidium saccamoebae]